MLQLVSSALPILSNIVSTTTVNSLPAFDALLTVPSSVSEHVFESSTSCASNIPIFSEEDLAILRSLQPTDFDEIVTEADLEALYAQITTE